MSNARELPIPPVCTCGHDRDYHGNADGQTGWQSRCGSPDCDCEDFALDCECTCTPQVFAHRHRDELLLAWFWPDGPMWLQAGGGPPVEVTSEQFATYVELGWSPVDVAPGAVGVWVTAPTGPTYFELVR